MPPSKIAREVILHELNAEGLLDVMVLECLWLTAVNKFQVGACPASHCPILAVAQGLEI